MSNCLFLLASIALFLTSTNANEPTVNPERKDIKYLHVVISNHLGTFYPQHPPFSQSPFKYPPANIPFPSPTKNTHTDVGFTDYSAKVVNEYFHTYFPRARKLAEELKEELDFTYVWTTHPWLVEY